MKIIKRIFKGFLFLFILIISYFLVALILTTITVNDFQDKSTDTKAVFLNTNGVHLDIVLPISSLSEELIGGLKYDSSHKYLSFGWGDENFYINTPTWGDLTFGNAFSALFLNSNSLIHVTRYRNKQSDWVEVNLNENQLINLNKYIHNSFSLKEDTLKDVLFGKGYSYRDDFYRAKGSYSCLKTCNTWVNSAFKQSGLKACYWTPFDFGLMGNYE